MQTSEPQAAQPLDGITVVAAEQAVAGPLATRHLADLGARVIKVERMDGGDLARGYDDVVYGTSGHFVMLNRGKESLSVDLKCDEGRRIVRGIIDGADVFLQNLAPGAAARLTLGADDLRRGHPELVVVNLSGFGAGGPMSARKAYDLIIQAESGLISLTGTAETSVKSGIPTADIATGMYAAQAVLAALLRRARTGEGAVIEISMLEAMVEWLGHSLNTQLFSGRQPPRMRMGHAAIAPYNAYPTLDGEVLVGVQSDPGWRALAADVLDAPELGEDPRFATNMARVLNRDDCDRVVSARTAVMTSAELTDRLAEAGVPGAQINDLADVVDHPQLAARDRWRTVRTEHADVPALLPPVTFSDVESAMGSVPALGEHNATLMEEIGYDAESVADLRARSVIG